MGIRKKAKSVFDNGGDPDLESIAGTIGLIKKEHRGDQRKRLWGTVSERVILKGN